MKVAVLGSGSGTLAVAADMSRHGRHTVMADFADFHANLEPVAEQGGVTISDDEHGPATESVTTAQPDPTTAPVTTAATIPEALDEALDGAELAVVAVPCSAHERWVQAIAPHTTPDQTVLFVGEAARRHRGPPGHRAPTTVAEANTLPYLVRPTGPGAVSVFRKRGGVLISALPPTRQDTARVMELVGDVWPCATATDTVWTTVLTSYDAIDRVAAMAVGAGTLENPAGGMPPRGEGATPATEEGTAAAAPNPGDNGPNPGGSAPNTGHTTEDAPCALVLASSLGEAAWVPTPVIDGRVAAASAMLGRDFRAEGRTLAALGLGGLDVTGLVGFARTGVFP